MIRKLIKVGSKLAVRIPKKMIAEMGLKVGDRIKVIVKDNRNTSDYRSEAFMQHYGEALRQLSQK